MGYTHYFYQNASLTDAQWGKVLAAVTAVSEKANVALDISVHGGKVLINGVGDDAHETLVLRQRPEMRSGDEEAFEFCKTAMKPYDKAVCAILVALKKAAPKAIRLSSDGEWSDWLEGRELYASALDAKAPVKDMLN